jgi:hypothetical protein
MEITGSFSGFRSFRASSQLRTLQMAASLLPTPGRSSSGLGLGQDIYAAVSKQTQGLYSGGRTAMNAAYAVLGIDNSQTLRPKAEPEAETDPAPAPAPQAEAPTRNITDELLKQSGYVQPEANPYVVQTDFFA